MENLWSPWRSKYIGTFKDNSQINEHSCFLCNELSNFSSNHNIEKNSLIVERRQLSFAILNKFPYNNGHLLIVPNRHIDDFEQLSDEEHLELNILIKDSIKLLKELYSPHGFNVGLNLGRVAGAGLPGHLHYHVIPRWNGDTSFMATTSDIKVVSIAIEETQKELSELFKKLKV